MEKIYDYVIIGAGPAGCFCASELFQKGYSVCILEKNEKNARKVCGDGINSICTEVLNMMDFPVENLIEAGALPIKYYHIYKNKSLKTIDLALQNKTVFGLPRNITDRVFQEYLTEVFRVPIFYGNYVTNIKKTDNIYTVCGYKTKKLILAVGTNTAVKVNNEKILKFNKDRPLGVSMIVKGRKAEKPFFMFDYDSSYKGTYAWIFCIGNGMYNVGIWLKSEKETICEKFNKFLVKRTPEWIGNCYDIEVPLKGAIMGIGNQIILEDKNILVVGDAANSSNPLDGEGISQAIVSAKEIIMNI